MDSVEALVAEMRTLTPGQLERVADLIRELAHGGRTSIQEEPQMVIAPALIDRAVSNGWPQELFTEVIGRMGDDFVRPPQPPYDVRVGFD